MEVQKTIPYNQKILDFDIENRPLSYWYDGNPTAEITAIAASFHGSDYVWCGVLGEDSSEDILIEFVSLYNEADIVTGHFIRKHDLPMINGALMELRMPPLPQKLTSDTKMDLMSRGAISASQEALSAMFDLAQPKHHMNQSDWREANRLTPEGLKKTRKRAISDVVQHKELYKVLQPYLKQPKIWRP